MIGLGRWKLLPLVVFGLLLLAACGGAGNGDGDGGGGGTADDQAAGATTAPEGNGEEPETSSSGGNASIDDPPAAGEARLELDGAVYTGETHICDITDTAVMVGAGTEIDGAPYDIGVSAGRGGSNWTGQVGLTPRETGDTWISGGVDVALDGSSVLVVAEFSRMGDSGAESVGEGRFLATCP